MTSLPRLIMAAALAAPLAACGERTPERGDDASAEGAQSEAADWSAARLIPRALLFGDPQRARGRLSPDGTQLAWVEPAQGVLNILTAPVDHPEDVRVLTSSTEVGVYTYDWLKNNTHIVYSLGRGGAEPQQVYSVDVITGETRNLSPGGDATSSWLAASSWDYPDEVIVAANDRDPDYFDLHRVNVVTGDSERVFVNDQRFTRLYLDRSLRLRMASRSNEDGDRELHMLLRDGEWRYLGVTPAEDAATTSILGFDAGDSAIYSLDSRDRDAAALTRFDLASQETTVLAAVSGADITDVLLHPTTYEADAVLIDGLSEEWLPLTARAATAFRALDQHLDNSFAVLSRTVDDRLWIVLERGPTNPGAYHLYNRETGEIERLIDVRPELASQRLAPMTSVIITSRDGLELASYLTLPAGADADGDGRPETRSPLVIIPDAGPQRNANQGYDAAHQWLADRGYAALSIHVRGAAGFGKAFRTAGDGVNADAVTDDLGDAIAWAVEQGVADPERVAAFGDWFGGLASLTAAAEPDAPFACVASYHAPSDLIELAKSAPASWADYALFLRQRLGDPHDPDTRARLAARSPVNFIADIRVPTLIAHGGLGGDAQHEMARQTALRANHADAPVTYVGFAEDAGLLIAPRDRRAFYAVFEAFLADCLGGRLEPIEEDVRAANLDAVIGADNIRALAAALEP